MNLVAKEYVACKRNGDGVLLLSEFAGAAAEMGEALLINSFDEDRTADVVSRSADCLEARAGRPYAGTARQSVTQQRVSLRRSVCGGRSKKRHRYSVSFRQGCVGGGSASVSHVFRKHGVHIVADP
jgi:hypothetical protein